jgi:hypothetical protein
MIIPAVIMTWQVVTADASVADNPRFRFWMNGWVGFAVTAAILLEVAF